MSLIVFSRMNVIFISEMFMSAKQLLHSCHRAEIRSGPRPACLIAGTDFWYWIYFTILQLFLGINDRWQESSESRHWMWYISISGLTKLPLFCKPKKRLQCHLGTTGSLFYAAMSPFKILPVLGSLPLHHPSRPSQHYLMLTKPTSPHYHLRSLPGPPNCLYSSTHQSSITRPKRRIQSDPVLCVSSHVTHEQNQSPSNDVTDACLFLTHTCFFDPCHNTLQWMCWVLMPLALPLSLSLNDSSSPTLCPTPSFFPSPGPLCPLPCSMKCSSITQLSLPCLLCWKSLSLCQNVRPKEVRDISQLCSLLYP